MKNSNDSENKTQYMPIFMCMGISIGMALGAALDNIPIGMCLGLGIGVCLGSALDAKKRKESDNVSEADDEE